MPKDKDIAEKILLDINEIFAEIMNVFLFGGADLVKPEELENAATVSYLKMADGIHEQERDVLKRWKRENVTVLVCGAENQARPHSGMPLRLFGYDGANYRQQVSQRESEARQKKPLTPYYPVVTLVLYYGLEPWSGPKTLRECFQNVSPAIEPYIPKYPIHLVEVAFLKREQIAQLKSDFRFVADYLVQKRTTGTYVPPDDRIVHVDETLKLMCAVTGDNRFEESVNALAPREKEGVTMCSVVESFVNQGRQEGRQEMRREYEAIVAEKDRKLKEQNSVIEDMARKLHEYEARYGLA